MTLYNFTVIIPHKDIPELLQRAIDSVPQRDDLQLIVVDDNSDPAKVDFEHFPGLYRPNTEVILTKEGRGAGYARNVGLDHAHGKWVLFLDADDELLPAINDILDECASDEVSDMIYYETKSYNVDRGQEERNPYIPMSGHSADDLRYRITMISSKIIRKSIIDNHNIRCEEIGYSNDTFFSIKCAFYCKNLRIIPIVGYNYLTHSGSLWQTWTFESIECRIASAARYYKFGKRHNIPQVQKLAQGVFRERSKMVKKKSRFQYIKILTKYSWRFDLAKEYLKGFIYSKFAR